MIDRITLWNLDDQSLLNRLAQLSRQERKTQVNFLIHLSEVDKRRLYASEGYSSLFSYLCEKFNYSESTALKRIQVARAARKHHLLYEFLERGLTSITAISKLAPHLKKGPGEDLIRMLPRRTVKEVENLVAEHFPESELEQVKSRVRAMSKDRVEIKFCADKALAEKLTRAKELLSHKYPNGNLEDIFGEAMDHLLNKIDPKRKATRKQPPTKQKTTRYIPQVIRNSVWKQADGECSFVSHNGKKCRSRTFLEYDHVKPWAIGGKSNKIENIRLLCRTHNRLMAERTYGEEFIDRRIGARVRES